MAFLGAFVKVLPEWARSVRRVLLRRSSWRKSARYLDMFFRIESARNKFGLRMFGVAGMSSPDRSRALSKTAEPTDKGRTR